MKENEIICGDWHGCYDDSWQGIIVPEAFAHPAKMAYGLTKRIFKHALTEGWIKPADVVVDPFGGIGSTGIVGAHLGLQVVCVELEEKFVRMAKGFNCAGLSKKEWVRWYNRFNRNNDICPTCQLKAQTWYEWCSGEIPSAKPHHFTGNFELHRKSIEQFSHFGKTVYPVIIQGDSRKLSEIIAGADCLIGSPPFSEPNMQPTGKHQGVRSDYPKMNKVPEYQAKTEGNLAAMKPGQLAPILSGGVDAVISSPPFSVPGSQIPNVGGDRPVRSKQREVPDRPDNYGSSPGNLGNLRPGCLKPGEIDNQVDCVVSSPPFESQVPQQDKNFSAPHDSTRSLQDSTYGQTKGNLGNDKGDTFWAAAKTIISECHKILKPGGHAIWVVKAFVRKGRIVDFPGDWRRLCESVGFVTVHEHHAMLVKETIHTGLFGTITETKERKSFFRRLAEKKGSPKIDYEVVLCTRKNEV